MYYEKQIFTFTLLSIIAIAAVLTITNTYPATDELLMENVVALAEGGDYPPYNCPCTGGRWCHVTIFPDMTDDNGDVYFGMIIILMKP